MRTIKFRGKTLPYIDDGEPSDNRPAQWVVGNFIAPNIICGDIVETDSDNCCLMPEYYHIVDPASVGQFTGSLDKNGREIYEGDIILRFSNINKISDPHLTDRNPEYMPAYVEFIQGIYRISSKEFPVGGCGVLNYSNANAAYNIEVIGNIHDTPELLKTE